ncbi:MAG: winged helix-turn-helix domain-containing protein [Cyanobacteria bacterium P01_F01_bin.150]
MATDLCRLAAGVGHPQSGLYEEVANRLQDLITNGTLKSGDRLLSVRKLIQQLSVSLSTALEAYRLLEDRGLIMARPQSGYYVKSTALQLLWEPHSTQLSPKVCCEFDMSLAFQLLSKTPEPNIIQLGAAVPSLDHLAKFLK